MRDGGVLGLDPLPHEPMANFDLDGTLADFPGAMKAAMEALAAPGETAYCEEQDDEPSHVRARRRMAKKVPGFWADLPRLKLGFDVLAITRELRYTHMILSKGPRSNPDAWAEKIVWCRRNMPDDDYGITLTDDKGLVYGKVLVDDWPKYVRRWLTWRRRGLVIMPAHSYNAGFEHPQVVRYDGTNLQEVRDRLIAQRATAGE